ncbi:MAG: glycosyltransferase [Terriglobales bacterium]
MRSLAVRGHPRLTWASGHDRLRRRLPAGASTSYAMLHQCTARKRAAASPMRLLWAKNDFLHPPTRGGQIRTLEMLRRLARHHEIHYVALSRGDASHSAEYCFRAYPIEHRTRPQSRAMAGAMALRGLGSRYPVAVGRYRSEKMRCQIASLCRTYKFDAVVCDFLAPALNMPDLEICVLFQHNVEAMIWKRHAANAPDPIRRWYLRGQAARMAVIESEVCRAVRSVIAVSEADAELMRKLYQPRRIDAIGTGVDIDYFRPPASAPARSGLVFVGAMDWLPNSDGVVWFVREVLPLIHREEPDCQVIFAGRQPGKQLLALASTDARIQVTGTVPDIRPYLWGAAVSIVPLHVGGGTRLKIFESMAAGLPVVSTSVGAEGLPVRDGIEIRIADNAQAFADGCLGLLQDAKLRRAITAAASELIQSRFSWETVAKDFERLLAG